MGEQPLVAGPQLRVIAAVILDSGLCGIGAFGQGDQHAEALGCVHMAGRVVQRRGVDFHQCACRDAERLDLGGVQLAARDFLLPGKQQHKIFGTQIELAVAVVFQAVQIGVVTVAPAQLAGHAAEKMLRHFDGGGQFLQGCVLGYIIRSCGQRGVCQGGQNFRFGGIQPGHNAAIGLEFRVGYRKNLHCSASISAKDTFSAGYSLCHTA